MYLSLVSWEILNVKWSHVHLSGDIPGKALSSALGYIPELEVERMPHNKQILVTRHIEISRIKFLKRYLTY